MPENARPEAPSSHHGDEERIVPGTALWDAHYAEHEQRYAFAADQMTSGRNVLDAGCGVGYGAALLADRGASQVAAVDISDAALSIARERFGRPAITWLAEDCHELRLAGARGPFDLVVNLENLEHLADPARFLSRVSEVLMPGGVLVTSVPNRVGVNRLRGKPADARSDNPFHFREYTLLEFRALLAAHFDEVALHAQTYDPIDRMTYEPVLRSVWNDPMLRAGRMLRRALGRPALGLDELLPPRRWQIVAGNLDDALVINNLAVCRVPRPAGG